MYLFLCRSRLSVNEINDLWRQIFRTQVVLRTRRNLIDRALLYVIAKTGELWSKGSPLRAKIHKGKNFVTLLVHRLTERDEIWHNDGHWSTGGLKRFSSRTLLQFLPPYGVKYFHSGYLAHFLSERDEVWQH